MICEDLIGYQLVSINDGQIVVQKDNKKYYLNIDDYSGDCCGYNEITTNLLISETELNRNPVITNVEMTSDEEGEGMSARLTFFGEYKPMAIVDTYSSSGSGWGYGAYVSIVCDALGINEEMSYW